MYRRNVPTMTNRAAQPADRIDAPTIEPAVTDTVKSRKQLRQERREQKRREKEAKKALEANTQ